MAMENNNNLQVPCTVAEVADYMAKYVSKEEYKDDILQQLKQKLIDNKRFDPNDVKSELSKFMSLAIK
jgi:hypothetical protein